MRWKISFLQDYFSRWMTFLKLISEKTMVEISFSKKICKKLYKFHEKILVFVAISWFCGIISINRRLSTCCRSISMENERMWAWYHDISMRTSPALLLLETPPLPDQMRSLALLEPLLSLCSPQWHVNRLDSSFLLLKFVPGIIILAQTAKPMSSIWDSPGLTPKNK